MREQACATVTELLDEDDRIAVILGEISISLFGEALRRFPSRVINIGIMEQTMVGVAAGLAMGGFLPVVHTINPFLVGPPLEQVKLDFGYQPIGGRCLGAGVRV